MSTAMKAPSGAAGSVQALSGTTYTPDSNGYVSVAVGDVVSLLNAGYMISQSQAGGAKRDQFTATTNPTVNSDSTQDFGVGSVWYNANTGMFYECVDPTAIAAVWRLLSPGGAVLLGKLLGANMNVLTDQPLVMMIDALVKFRVTKITAENASLSLTTAVGGVYDAAAKGGNAIVANTQVYSALTAATIALDLTIATTPGKLIEPAGTPIILALSTIQGAASTADFYAYGDLVI